MLSNSNNQERFAARSYFFTDPGSFSQSAAQSFGPINEEQYRLTSKFTSNGAMAYAICKGTVLVQPHTGNENLVNLILHPLTQPMLGVNIKYFIYRGLNKHDFFNGPLIKAIGADSSDWLKQVNAAFTSYYAQLTPVVTQPPFLASFVGFDPAAQNGQISLNAFFFKSSMQPADGTASSNLATTFELPLLDGGASLGHFSTAECGLDVVLNYGDYELPQPHDEFVFDLTYARAAEAVLDVTSIAPAFKRQQIREQIFQFLDVAAYYGMHCREDSWVKIAGQAPATKTGLAVYEDLLTNWATKNRLYLYIQSDRTRSYNFYGNYSLDEEGNSLKMGITEATMVPKAYQTQSWPLLIESRPQTHDEDVNRLYLQLVTDNNVNTMLWGQVGLIENAQSNNFCGADNLRSPDVAEESEVKLTKNIVLSNLAAGLTGNKFNVAGFSMLLYQGKTYMIVENIDGDESNSETYTGSNTLNHVFDKLTSKFLFQGAYSSSYSTLTSQRLKLMDFINNTAQISISAVQTVRVCDALETGVPNAAKVLRVSHVTEAVASMNNPVSPLSKITSNLQSSSSQLNSITENTVYELPDPFFFTITKFTESGVLINGLKLESRDSSIPNKILLGLTQAEYDALESLAETLTNSTAILQHILPDDNGLLSSENISYRKFRAAIAGERSEGILEMKFPLNDVFVYSLDGKIFYTKDYSEHIQYKPILNLTLDTEITL
jgi:hypothetical protein